MTPEPFELTPEDRIAIRAAIAEIDPAQVEINRRLTPAQRFMKACSMSDTVIRIAVYRLCQAQPALDAAEAQRIVLARYYANQR